MSDGLLAAIDNSSPMALNAVSISAIMLNLGNVRVVKMESKPFFSGFACVISSTGSTIAGIGVTTFGGSGFGVTTFGGSGIGVTTFGAITFGVTISAGGAGFTSVSTSCLGSSFFGRKSLLYNLAILR
jgi:succinate-acetate transporter protein